MNARVTGCTLVLLGIISAATFGQSAYQEPVTVWDTTVAVSGALGYRNNVLRSSVIEENSLFFMTSLDASLMRLSESDSFFMLYFFGEDIRYFDSPSVNYEQFFTIAAQGAVPVFGNDEVGANVDYLYQHQIYDASETQVDQRRILVLAHSLSLRPYWTHFLNAGWEMRLAAGAFRQVYEQELDDYSEADAQIGLTRKYGRRSEITATYQYLQRIYDTREQFDEDGFIIPGTDLFYTQNNLSGYWKRYWDEARNWRTITRISGMMNQDNGSGYFDYNRLLLKQQVRWDNGKWDIKSNARFGWYLYGVQQVAGEDRERSYALLDLRIERRLGAYWNVFTTGEYEWNFSNDPRNKYNTWMVHAGLGVEF